MDCFPHHYYSCWMLFKDCSKHQSSNVKQNKYLCQYAWFLILHSTLFSFRKRKCWVSRIILSQDPSGLRAESFDIQQNHELSLWTTSHYEGVSEEYILVLYGTNGMYWWQGVMSGFTMGNCTTDMPRSSTDWNLTLPCSLELN